LAAEVERGLLAGKFGCLALDASVAALQVGQCLVAAARLRRGPFVAVGKLVVSSARVFVVVPGHHHGSDPSRAQPQQRPNR
jgi:hypothetical protein